MLQHVHHASGMPSILPDIRVGIFCLYRMYPRACTKEYFSEDGEPVRHPSLLFFLFLFFTDNRRGEQATDGFSITPGCKDAHYTLDTLDSEISY